MSTSTILAIGLGKYNSVSCHFEPETKLATFRTIRTSPDEMRKLLARQPVALVVIEACSGAGWVTDLCQSLGFAVAVANTAGEAWKWQHVKRKTEGDHGDGAQAGTHHLCVGALRRRLCEADRSAIHGDDASATGAAVAPPGERVGV